MDIESVAMTIIAYSGDARSTAFTALSKVRQGLYQEGEAMMAQAKESSIKAHKAQTSLLVEEAKGNEVKVNVLLVHSQDHLMTSMLALELIEELIYLHKEKANV